MTRLARAALAAPAGNILGLIVAIHAGQCTYPNLTISDVIRASPGLNVVAAGWTVFAACFSLLSYIQHEMLTIAAQIVGDKLLDRWLELRRYVAIALLLLMSLIHLCPLQPAAPSLLRDAVHFGTAGAYAGCGVLEAYLLVRCIEPTLREQGLLVSNDGEWLRKLCLYLSPGWVVVAVLGGVGMACKVDELMGLAAALEFSIITIYGCYPLALPGIVCDLERQLEARAVPAPFAHADSVAPRGSTRRGGRSPSRRRGSVQQHSPRQAQTF